MKQELELARAVSIAGQRVGEAVTATASHHEIGAVQKEAWGALGEGGERAEP